MSSVATLRLVAALALRSLLAHRTKSVIVGAILFFGTFGVVTGTALLDSVQASMQRSITASLAGHIQVYDADAKDPLALFGDGTFGGSDVGEIPEFRKVEAALVGLEHVEAVVPMGIANATVFNGTELDRVLAALRDAVREGDVAGQALLAEQVRSIARNLRKDLEVSATIAADKDKAARDKTNLDRVQQEDFWAGLTADPLPLLEFLDTELAPLSADGRLLFVRVLGTNFERYRERFESFRIVDGEPIPPGQKGLLFAKRVYEEQVKNTVARELDKVKTALAEEGSTIAADPLLQEKIRKTARQYQRVLYQLAPTDARELETALRAELGQPEGDLAALLESFLLMDDSNFARRHAFFYAEIAPRIRLYEAPVGEVVTLRAFTKSGYVRSVNVKVYGTFEFKGLESSDLAGVTNLADLITFRELYGKMSDAQQAELAELKATVGAPSVDRADAEAALFGGPAPEPSAAAEAALFGGEAAVAPAAPPASGGFAEIEAQSFRKDTETADTRVYDDAEMNNGLALNAAVLLDDPRHIDRVIEQINTRSEAEGWGIQAVDWESASGIIGQFILVLQVVLYVAIFIVFLVALFIINNAMVMATMERITEIGTMRAIGAQRGWVTLLFVAETVVLGLIAGSAGALAAVGFITWLASVGIPAGQDVLVVLFAGPRLYPTVSPGNVAFGLLSVLGISILSTLYPAVLAARVPPVVAMAQKE